MYFYRLMSKKEFKSKKIHDNKNQFDKYINTHKYKNGENYVHLFLNAESCFESFGEQDYDNSVIAKFDIPDKILNKYRIELGGYGLTGNAYSNKNRILLGYNSIGKYNFWLPEIAISENDFDYSWLIDYAFPKNMNDNLFLPDDFKTDPNCYRDIVLDGYLIGYNSEQDLVEYYKRVIALKNKIIKILKTSKKINIFPKKVNNDSLYATKVLVDYAIKNGYINNAEEIYVSVNDILVGDAINFSDQILNDDNIANINKNFKHTNPTFCSMIDYLGFHIDKKVLYSITNDKDYVVDYTLKKLLML